MAEEVTTTYLEMTAIEQLVPGRAASAPIDLHRVDATINASLLRSIYTRVGAPHGWRNSTWPEEKWLEWLARGERQRWIIRIDNEPAGLVELEAHDDNNVEIVVFGLVAEFVGQGFGGAALTLAVRLAWDLPHADCRGTKRVWLHTCSRDHPNAMGNYVRRGLRSYRVEHEQRTEAGLAVDVAPSP